MLQIARKLAESEYINKKIRQNIYIHGVKCACETKTPESNENSILGKNCFCDINVDLLGANKHIRTNIEQPTDDISIEVDPVNFKKFADTNPLSIVNEVN